MSHEDNLFLIVDDEPDMCWALEHIFEQIGVSSKKAQSGQEALTLVEQNRFVLAFLDAKLPDIEGLELAGRIREADPSVPIVMVSGYFYRNDEGIQNALAGGLISGFVPKPFLHDEIVHIIKSTLAA